MDKTPEMVERVATALWNYEIHLAPERPSWGALSEEERENIRRPTRIGIEAMRDPTEAMVDAGNQSGDWGPGSTADGTDASPERCWNAMIDAALK